MYLLYQLLLKILVFALSYFEPVMLFLLYHRFQQIQQQQLLNILYQYLKISQKKIFIYTVIKKITSTKCSTRTRQYYSPTVLFDV